VLALLPAAPAELELLIEPAAPAGLVSLVPVALLGDDVVAVCPAAPDASAEGVTGSAGLSPQYDADIAKRSKVGSEGFCNMGLNQ
jgi:hypothetical protein